MKRNKGDRERETLERRSQERAVNATLPAGLEDSGRAEELEHGDDVHPSGAAVDHRHTVPGATIPGAPRPPAEAEELGRIRETAKRSSKHRRDSG